MSQIADANGNGRLLSRNDVHYVSGSPGTGKSHLAQAIGQSAIQQGYRVLYRETHKLLDDLGRSHASTEPAKNAWNCSFPCRF